MNRILAALAGIAWATATISNAAPADAILYTQTSGAYASCSANYQVSMDPCDNPGYRQTIKVISSACNSGGCNDSEDNFVDVVYSPGRKTASYSDNYCNGYYAYNLGACAC